ncbi:hypothetical protein ACLI09_15875 [Flavobacterium sp. RHBU_24]|uniref:hypothetical protein n=1 Tax=Flavobacterium sp. RHBU_24 TaxID=3391185 RepID=UPI003984FF1C
MINRVIFYIILSSMILSCARKLSQKNINRPFEKDFEKGTNEMSKWSRKANQNFDEYNQNKRAEHDGIVEIRNKVIDSLGLLSKNKWLLISQYGTNYEGPYEKTYFLLNDKYFVYYMSTTILANQSKKVIEYDIDNLKSDIDVYKIHDAFYNALPAKKIDSEPSVNPWLIYNIIQVKDGRIYAFRISSEDYKIKKWN